jgi:hypothetical protein
MTPEMKRRTALVATLPFAWLGFSCGSSDGDAGAAAKPVIDPGDHGDYHASLDPDGTVDVIDNPYLPLRPGMRWVYEGSEDGTAERDTVVVTDQRRTVMGVSAVVVHDVVTVRGEVTELTDDWYTQDSKGNVWYLGEDTAEYEHGQITSREGSWEAGVHGAQPGIAMPAHPKRGEAYREEYDRGNAEDLGEVLRTTGSAHIDLGTYKPVLVIREWTPLEPNVVETKTYAPGVGQIVETITRGGRGRMELIEFTS